MNSTQREILGTGYALDIYHDSYAPLHCPAQPDSYFSDEDEQTYEEFVDMGKRNPNNQGTGRWKLQKKRKKIAIYDFGTDESQGVQGLAQLVAAFFSLEVDIVREDKALDLLDNSLRIGDLVYDISSWKKRISRGASATTEYIVDVFSLFDVMVNIALPPYMMVLGVFNCKLAEEYDSKCGYTEVLGRACGDRVACVSAAEHDSRKTLLATMLHELCHTIGFDHCSSWQCLMNARQAEDFLFLSPVNLRKLKVFHGIPDEDKMFLLDRYNKLQCEFELLGVEFSEELQWVRNKIDSLRRLISEHKVEIGLKRKSEEKTESLSLKKRLLAKRGKSS